MNETAAEMKEIDAAIDAWAARTREMTGKEVVERQPWNTEVNADAIRQFCYGTDDDNPLYLDPAYAAKGRHGGVLAPPAFLVSHRYPILHGAPMKAPLASLIGGVEYRWSERIRLGDRIASEPRQKEFFEKRNKEGRRLNFVISEVVYRNQTGAVVGVANGTMIMATQVGAQVMFEQQIHKVTEADLERLEAMWRAERRAGANGPKFEDVEVGQALPPIVRGPLAIGDMVAWNAAIGPSYKAGRWGYLDLTRSMHTAAWNPVTGFPVKYSQQHEDFNLAAQRGMPGAFDNGVMRFAWVAPLVTNWMGDDGFLRRLYVQVRRPGIYGDLVTYAAKVIEKVEADAVVKIEITGTNQLGQVSTAGNAEVALPRR
ncbi:MAG: MaoC family dehydratase N-terminal domain-containing protein [Proteobacteria bacterium]|nr:MaoC family dehydratase N-terminal domain-containing protein [Pseudomonadota bacterium]